MTRQKAWSEVEISAYLDGELDAPTRQAFEAAVGRDADLRRQVDALRAVIALVHTAPLREPPRNYLLTPGMVAETSSKRMVQRRTPLLLMRLATSFTAVAFVMTMGLNFLSRGVGPGMVTQDSVEFNVQVPVTVPVEKMVAEPAVEAAVEEKLIEAPPSPQKELEFAPLQAPKAPEEGVGGGEAAPELVLSQSENASPAADAQKVEGDAGGEAMPEGLRAMSLSESVTETTALGEGVMLDATTSPAVAEELPETPIAIEPLMAYADDGAGEPSKASRCFATVWLPGALGVATLVLAGVTLWMSRRR